ncbi:hypothetical protein V8G54_023212 [Vigna mungo]|uniref:Uncharacterized protein n=1 Tax=Vigna mungo TaxID=3915 RepID=A0AAQ3N4V5_VIGMU
MRIVEWVLGMANKDSPILKLFIQYHPTLKNHTNPKEWLPKSALPPYRGVQYQQGTWHPWGALATEIRQYTLVRIRIDLVTVEPWEGHVKSDRCNEKGIEGERYTKRIMNRQTKNRKSNVAQRQLVLVVLALRHSPS